MPDTTDDHDEPTVTDRTIARLERENAALRAALTTLRVAAVPLTAHAGNRLWDGLMPSTPVSVPLSCARAVAAILAELRG